MIEVLVTTAMTLAVTGSIFGAMIAQQRSYALQLDSSDASRNARAALTIIQSELRMAGWGMQGRRASAFPPVGSCNTQLPNNFLCNNQPDVGGDSTTLSDRLRIISMVPGRFDDNTIWAGPNNPRTHDQIEFLVSEGRPPGIPDDALALIDGQCLSPVTEPVVQLVEIDSANGAVGGFWHDYRVVAPNTEYPAPTCDTFAPGFRMSMARVVDFYIDRTLEEDGQVVPRLMMHVNPFSRDVEGDPTQPEVVAYHIDSLQLEHLIDLGTDRADDTPDQIFDLACHSLVDAAECNTAVASDIAFRPDELASRTIAMRIGIIPRADSPSYDPTSPDPAFGDVFDRNFPPDRFRRWVFRSTVRLRNNEID